jgi:DNA polymerase I
LTGDTPSLDEFFPTTRNNEEDRVSEHKGIDDKRERDEDEIDLDAQSEEPTLVETDQEEEEEEEAESKIEGVTGHKYATEVPPSILLSVRYDGESRCAFARLYDPDKKQLRDWKDNTGHLPYCYTDIPPEIIRKNFPKIVNHPGFKDLVVVEKHDLLSDKQIQMTKIVATDPLAIGGRTDSIREVLPDNIWEAKIPYHICYIYDRGLTPGMIYRVSENQLLPVESKIAGNLKIEFSQIFEKDPQEFRQLLPRLLPYFLEPTPDIRRVAVDIEVRQPILDRIPDATTAEHSVVAVSLASNDGLKEVYMLKPEREDEDYQDLVVHPPSQEFRVTLFDTEKKLLEKTFEALNDYPLVLTFNGDLFDLRYLSHRAQRLHIESDKSPIILTRDRAMLKRGEHIDLYRFFFNRSIQVYAFSNKYRDLSLDTVSKALIGIGKVEVSKSFDKLSPSELAMYNWQDSKITLGLTQFNGNLVLNLILLIMRLSHLPIEDVTRQAVSAWIRSLFYFEHREAGYLIPRPQDISRVKGNVDTKAIIKGKKYLGAIVVEPEKGVHFNVAVLDFASLYPSIIKTRNLSYETVRCTHTECKTNKIPETTHWVCIKRRGISSLLIGFFRDVRVKWFKPKSKDKRLGENERDFYEAVSQALKVFLNASYGVFGADTFPLYCPPVAESTTAVGRYAIKKTIDKARELGVQVIYGDSLAYDRSIFVQNLEGDVSLRKIGEFVDQNMADPSGYRTLALENGKTKFQPILRLIRHRYNGQMLTITAQRGTTVVTPQHSIYTYKDGNISLCDARELRKGDLLISLTNPRLERLYLKRRRDKPGVIGARLQGARSEDLESENFSLTTVTGIRKSKYLHLYVYDIEVEGAHNFADAEGMILVHNTDSVFLKNPTDSQVREIFDWSARSLGIDLELDKRYRYLALSERKKNYLGVYEDGTVDIKGLTGKKRNTPEFLKKAFREMVQGLGQVHSTNDFDEARRKIKEIVQTCYRKLEKHEYSLEDLAFGIELTKDLDDYKKTTPQHVKAARQLRDNGADVKAGQIIFFVKVKGPAGVRPVSQANVNEIDVEKYKDQLKSTFEQVLDALGIEFHEIMGYARLDTFY